MAFPNVVRCPGACYADHNCSSGFASPSVVSGEPSGLASQGQSSIEGGKLIGYLSP